MPLLLEKSSRRRGREERGGTKKTGGKSLFRKTEGKGIS